MDQTLPIASQEFWPSADRFWAAIYKESSFIHVVRNF
jgi:hypothetical protein